MQRVNCPRPTPRKKLSFSRHTSPVHPEDHPQGECPARCVFNVLIRSCSDHLGNPVEGEIPHTQYVSVIRALSERCSSSTNLPDSCWPRHVPRPFTQGCHVQHSSLITGHIVQYSLRVIDQRLDLVGEYFQGQKRTIDPGYTWGRLDSQPLRSNTLSL